MSPSVAVAFITISMAKGLYLLGRVAPGQLQRTGNLFQARSTEPSLLKMGYEERLRLSCTARPDRWSEPAPGEAPLGQVDMPVRPGPRSPVQAPSQHELCSAEHNRAARCVARPAGCPPHPGEIGALPGVEDYLHPCLATDIITQERRLFSASRGRMRHRQR
jgi:hypothetical protein